MATHEDYSRTHDVAASSNRGFGWVFTAVFAVIGVWPLVSGGGPRWWSLGVAAAFLAVTLAAPVLLALPNKLWQRFGLLLNRIMSPVVLAFLFYAVITPIGAIKRRFGQDNLRLDKAEPSDSYWIKRDPPGPTPDSFNDQF